MSKDAYAATVSALRSKAGLTQQQVADELGVSLQTVKNFEAGRNRPRADTEKRLAAILGASVADFHSDPEAPPRATADEYPLELFIAERERLGVPLTADELGSLREFRFRGKAKSADDWVKILKFLPTIGR